MVGDVLLDAGSRRHGSRILRQLEGWTIAAHALTHAHPDHQGGSHEVCEALGIPLWCPDVEADAMESGDLTPVLADTDNARRWLRTMAGPAHPVARRLREGDEVAGFRVLETPGHSPGHLAYWREEDRTLIAGDVLVNYDLTSGTIGLREPPDSLTPDPALNRASARRIAELRPALVLFGHGPPLADPDALARFAESLAEPALAPPG